MRILIATLFFISPCFAEPLDLIPQSEDTVTIYLEPAGIVSATQAVGIKDPFESMNRVSFIFNDQMIQWIFTPVGYVYERVVPVVVQKGIRNFGYNLASPVRIISNLLQLKIRATGSESLRFMTNSTVGILGLFDVASRLGLKKYNEDFGQAFGRWGFGPGFYITVPVFGGCYLRDCIGQIFDYIFDPNNWIYTSWLLRINDASLSSDQYQNLVSTQLDPYSFLKELQYFHRHLLVQDLSLQSFTSSYEVLPTLAGQLYKTQDKNFHDNFQTKPFLKQNQTVKLSTTKKKFPFSLYLQKMASPLVFILPGVGSHRLDTNVLVLAENFYQAGFSVVAISSPFNPEFIKYGSTVTYAGVPELDAADAAHVFSDIKNYLDIQYPNHITKTHLVGYSLGALQALLIKHHRPLLAEKVIAINPPVDVHYAINVLDSYYEIAFRQPSVQATKDFILETMSKVMLLSEAVASGSLTSADRVPLSSEESQFLIGYSFRKGFNDSLYSMQTNKDDVRFARGQLFGNRKTYDELSQLSFEQYSKQYVISYAMKRLGVNEQEVMDRSKLHWIEDTLRSEKNIFVLHNFDDFVVSSDHLSFLQDTLGDRFIGFDRGGHLGNYGMPAYLDLLVQLLNR